MIKNKSPIKKISHAARQGAQLASVAAHRGSQFLEITKDKTSSVAQNGIKLSSAVAGSAASAANARRSTDGRSSFCGDRDGMDGRTSATATATSSSSTSTSPPFVSLRDRINKFDSAANGGNPSSTHAGSSNHVDSKLLSPGIGTRRKPRNRMKPINSGNIMGTLEDDALTSALPPSFNPNFCADANHQEAIFEKENEMPNSHHVSQPSPQKSTSLHTSTTQSPYASKTNSHGAPKHSPGGLASFTAAIRRTTPRKPTKKTRAESANEDSLTAVKTTTTATTSATNNNNNDNDGRKSKEHLLEQQLRELEKENEKLLNKNASLENTCKKLKRDNTKLESAVNNNNNISNSNGNAGPNSTKKDTINHPLMKKRNIDEHPLMKSPLRKHIKAVHEASESNSVVTIKKEPFMLRPPEETARMTQYGARENNSNSSSGEGDMCHLDMMGTLTCTKTKEQMKSNNSRSAKDNEPNNRLKKKQPENKEEEDALNLLNSAAFLFAGSSRREMY